MSNLRFIALSGTTDVTENLYIYESGNDMIVVDCGVGFPETEMYGVDLVIPDFSYIKENKKKLRSRSVATILILLASPEIKMLESTGMVLLLSAIP